MSYGARLMSVVIFWFSVIGIGLWLKNSKYDTGGENLRRASAGRPHAAEVSGYRPQEKAAAERDNP